MWASTGGFTDCLLQNGAVHVFAVMSLGQVMEIEAGFGVLTVIEHTIIRHMSLQLCQELVIWQRLIPHLFPCRLLFPRDYKIYLNIRNMKNFNLK